VLVQGFRDFEVVVVDNADDALLCEEVVRHLADDRVRYVRTGGLSMPDNWEAAVDAALGDYVIVLEDKAALKTNALETLDQCTRRHGTCVITWPFDTLDDGVNPPRYGHNRNAGTSYKVSSQALLKSFTQGRDSHYNMLLPIGIKAAYPRAVIAKIKQGPTGRFCLPVSCDYTMGFLALWAEDEIVYVDQPIILIGGLSRGNGRSGVMQTGLARQFLKELGGDENVYFDRMPIKAQILHNSVFNDFVTLADRVGGRLAEFPIDVPNYFAKCYADIVEARARGGDVRHLEAAWRFALRVYPDDVVNLVQRLLTGPTPEDSADVLALMKWEDECYRSAVVPFRPAEFAEAVSSRRSIVVDAVFFQMYKTGIARVWKSLLRQWAETEFGNRIVVLDRARSAPRFDGLKYVDVPSYDYGATDADRQMLQKVCDSEGAALFVSSYYTTPLTTPSVFMAYDMIPEVAGTNVVGNPMWREKHAAIGHAGRFIAISENTANDLRRFFPHIEAGQVAVAHCGVDFRSPGADAVAVFKAKNGIERPYYLMVGGRDGYKNGKAFFAAFEALGEQRAELAVVCTGPTTRLEPEYAASLGPGIAHLLDLTDDDLQAAYAGATALVYPSLYEGFGMPIVEAMACGCPVITTRAGSIPEVAGDAALFVDPSDIAGLARALMDIRRPEIREPLIARGSDRAGQFSWRRMAAEVEEALLKAVTTIGGRPATPPRPDPAAGMRQVTTDIPNALALGLQFHQSGRLDEAESVYRQILGAAPATFDALHMLGVARLQRNDPRQAEPLIRQALTLNDGSADAHYNLACVLKALGRSAEANHEFERTLELKPDPDVARRTLAHLGVAVAG